MQKVWESNEIMSEIDFISSSSEKTSDIVNSVCKSGHIRNTKLSKDEFWFALSLCPSSPIGYGLDGLSCSTANGKNPWHANANNILQRALKTGLVPDILVPRDCSRPDGKRHEQIHNINENC